MAVLWTNGDREVALNADQELQQEIKKMKDIGIELLAYKAYVDRYGISQKLEELEITVKYMGQPLTSMLKTD